MKVIVCLKHLYTVLMRGGLVEQASWASSVYSAGGTRADHV
jgi:hypothetical protein